LIWIKRFLPTLLLLVGAGVFVYVMRFSPLPALGHQLANEQIVAEVLGTGTLEARVSATISSKISGRVESLLVDQGDTVKQGQLLLTLEDSELSGQVAIAEANLQAALAALKRLSEDKKRMQVIADQAELSYQRVAQLQQQKAISQEEFDKAREALALGNAGVSLAEAAINEGQKELVAAEKNLEYQRARLSDTKIYAPFDGLIVRRDREAGDVVVPGSQIFSLISMNELWISAWVDETAISQLAIEQPARVVFRSEPARSYVGRVARLGKEADRETREFIVDVRVLQLPENWAVGQRAEVYINTGSCEDCLALPVEFLSRRDDVEGAQVLINGRAIWKPLEIGLRGREFVEVISGLTAGEKVVRAPDGGILPEGRPVKIR
jgi:RND family efflux transporter MFP subunit